MSDYGKFTVEDLFGDVAEVSITPRYAEVPAKVRNTVNLRIAESAREGEFETEAQAAELALDAASARQLAARLLQVAYAVEIAAK